MNKIIKKGDILIFVFALALSCIFFIIHILAPSGGSVMISSNGEKNVYPLNKDMEISLVNDDNKGRNKVIIKDGFVYMESADCPDLICVKHKPVSKNGECIICLPNQVYVEIMNDIDNNIDN